MQTFDEQITNVLNSHANVGQAVERQQETVSSDVGQAVTSQGASDNGASNFIVLAATKTEEVVQAITNKTIVDLAQNNEIVKARIEENAASEIENVLETQSAKTDKKKADTKFKGNEEACKVYGVEKTVPLWQQQMMAIGAGVWFVIYFVFATLTVAPISTFAYKLKVVFKNMWVAIIISLIVYLIVAIGLPFLIGKI